MDNCKICMICIKYDKRNKHLIQEKIKNNQDITPYITKVSIVSNEFVHISESNIHIYQILSDIQFSINCFQNEVLEFHNYIYQNHPNFKNVRNIIYNNLCLGYKLKDNIIKLCNHDLSYKTLIDMFKNNKLKLRDSFPCSFHYVRNIEHYDEILNILHNYFPIELCLIILKYLQKNINFTIYCYYSINHSSNKLHGFMCNPSLIIK